MEDTITIATVYKELKEFREENQKCWQQNEKRWEENDRRWKANDERWKTNDKKLTALEKLSESTDKRLTALEEGRVKDRRDSLDVLDAMQKSIDNQFSDLKEYMDVRFDKIYSAQMINDIEHAEFRQLLKVYGVRINLQNSRITYLENWKKECDDGFVAVN